MECVLVCVAMCPIPLFCEFEPIFSPNFPGAQLLRKRERKKYFDEQHKICVSFLVIIFGHFQKKMLKSQVFKQSTIITTLNAQCYLYSKKKKYDGMRFAVIFQSLTKLYWFSCPENGGFLPKYILTFQLFTTKKSIFSIPKKGLENELFIGFLR